MTQIWLLLLFVVTSPYVIRGLGKEAFGIFSLVLVTASYFGFLDLGMSQATVHLVSEHLARDEVEQAHRVVSTSVFGNFALGVFGSAVIATLTPFLVERFFKIPIALQGEARTSFYLLAISFPFLLIHGSLQGVPAAFQRFDLINLVTGVVGSLQALVTVGLVLLGCAIGGVVLANLAIRVVSTLAYLVILHRLLPDVRLIDGWHRPSFLRLLHFGGWIIVSYLVGPLMVNFDRILIGSLLTVGAVAYYAVPYGIASRLSIVSSGFSSALLPVFSQRKALADTASMRSVFSRSTGLLLLATVPLTVVLVLISAEILEIWMGVEYAREGTQVLRLLALAFLLNAVASVPFTVLWGLGRPDLTAKFHMTELPVYAALCVLLIPKLGIEGAAMAWTIRAAMDLVLLLWAVRRLIGASIRTFLFQTLAVTPPVMIAVVAVVAGRWTSSPAQEVVVRVLFAGAAIGTYVAFGWSYLLDAADRVAFRRAMRRQLFRYEQP